MNELYSNILTTISNYNSYIQEKITYLNSGYLYIINSIIDDEYVVATAFDDINSRMEDLAGYSYVYDAYSYVLGRIALLDMASGGSGNAGEGGIIGILFNNSAAEIQSNVAIINETQLSKGNTSGTGNAVTDISVSGHQITLTKGSTFLTSHQDLSTYVSKVELTSQSYLTSIPNTYATYAAISSMGYLTSHQDLSTYVSKTELSGQSYVTSSTLNNYVSKTELSAAGYITSGLPSVTSSDNGKILMVVNGTWQLVSPATIYSGNATPSNANGNNGDIYIQS